MNVIQILKLILTGEYVVPTTRQQIEQEIRDLNSHPKQYKEKFNRLRLGRVALKHYRRKNPCRGIVGPKVTREWRWVNPPEFTKECILRF